MEAQGDCFNNGGRRAVRLLIEAGAGIDDTAPNGSTALCYAALYGRRDVVAQLLELRADVSLASVVGKQRS